MSDGLSGTRKCSTGTALWRQLATSDTKPTSSWSMEAQFAQAIAAQRRRLMRPRGGLHTFRAGSIWA
eukprot:1148217-Pelagomonas_calceolata.AAC.3